MKRKVRFYTEARLELEDAILWYNDQKPGLGGRFEAEVYAICERIVENPERFRLIGKAVRIARLRVFSKYAVYYHVEPNWIGVVAVFHAKRNPDDLSRRLA